MAAEVKPSIGERDPPLHAPPVLLVLDYPSPPHPPVFRSRKRAMVIGGPHVAFATVAGAVFMSCLDRHGMALTAWVVAMACVYVVVRTSGAKHLTAGRRVQVILATFVSFVATVGAAVTYWGRANVVMEARQSITTLFRPVGEKELELIRESGFRAFPPQLPHQPIFYPVLNEEYAASIARDWNTKDAASGFVGYVTRFAVDTEYVQQFPIQTVDARIHQELWIPAERLEEFNGQIVGRIEVIAEFRGEG
jgi:hypothetical protein